LYDIKIAFIELNDDICLENISIHEYGMLNVWLLASLNIDKQPETGLWLVVCE
jgi:hypothetical protein